MREPREGKFTRGKFEVTKRPYNRQYWLYTIRDTTRPDTHEAPNPIAFQAVPRYIRRCDSEAKIARLWSYQTETPAQMTRQREIRTARLVNQAEHQRGLRLGLVA